MRGFKRLLSELWRDEIGVVLSAEAALLGTVAVIGATVGLSAVAKSMNEELTEVASAFRSLDQSYHFDGQRGCGAWTAGSCYEQPCVEESREELHEYVEGLEERQHHSEHGRHHEGDDADERDEQEADDHADHDHEADDDVDDADDDDVDADDAGDDDDRPRGRRDADDDSDDGPSLRDRDDDRDGNDDDELSVEVDTLGDEFAEPTRVRPAAGE